jgi:transcription antitermination factor NusG
VLIDPADSRLLWLVVRTKPKQERAVIEALQGRDLEAYLPRVLEPRRHRHGPLGPVPLFPSYVFARCVPRDRYSAVNYCPGANGLLRFGERIAAVEDEFIAQLHDRAGERGYLVMADARHRPVKGARARIVRGPLAGIEGIVERYLPARDRVRLLLKMVTAVRSVDVDAGDVQIG